MTGPSTVTSSHGQHREGFSMAEAWGRLADSRAVPTMTPALSSPPRPPSRGLRSVLSQASRTGGHRSLLTSVGRLFPDILLPAVCLGGSQTSCKSELRYQPIREACPDNRHHLLPDPVGPGTHIALEGTMSTAPSPRQEARLKPSQAFLIHVSHGWSRAWHFASSTA